MAVGSAIMFRKGKKPKEVYIEFELYNKRKTKEK